MKKLFPPHKPTLRHTISVSYFTHMPGVGQCFKQLKLYSYNRKYLIIFVIGSRAICAFNKAFVLLNLIHRHCSENIWKCWQDR